MRFPMYSLWLFVLSSTPAVSTVFANNAPSRIDVPLYFDPAGRYVMDVRMSEGTGLQNLSYAFTTGTGNIYVAACGGTIVENNDTPLYNQTQSTTAQIVSDEPYANVLGQATNATIVKETCAFVGAGGKLLPYSNQTLFVVKSLAQNVLEEAAHVRLGSQVSGIIGFGTNRVPSKPGEFCGSYEDSFIGQFFLQMPQLTNYTFGMALESPIIVPQQDSNATTGLSSASMIGSTAGILHLIQPDSSYYNADKISWTTTNVSAGTNGSTVPPSDWTVVLDGWVASTKSNQVSSKGKIVANLDPLYTGMYVPQNQAAVIHASIPGAALQKGLSTLGNLSMAYTIPCDARFTFGIVVDSQTFFVDQSNLIVSMGNGKCASSIEAWADPSQVQYVFGSRLMSTIYLIFTVPRDGSQQIGFSPRASGTSPLDVKSIVGGTVGGAALLALSIFAGLYFRKHWRSTQPRSAVPILPSTSEHEEPTKTAQTGWHIRPFTMMSPTSSQPLSPHTPLRTATSVSYPMSALSIGRSPSPPLSPVIVIEDDRSINVAPPSYRGHESYLASLPINSPGVIQASQSSGGASDYTARATCGSKEPL